jgi:tRNA(fMet)-specific endonuclease VapC
MTILYMLDTDTASYAISDRSSQVRSRLARVLGNEVCISAITRGELLFGVHRLPPDHPLQTRVRQFLIDIPALPWEADAADHYAEIRYRLERRGQPISPLDMMIAAHAIAAGAILVTNNARHFERVGPPLVLENWHR